MFLAIDSYASNFGITSDEGVHTFIDHVPNEYRTVYIGGLTMGPKCMKSTRVDHLQRHLDAYYFCDARSLFL